MTSEDIFTSSGRCRRQAAHGELLLQRFWHNASRFWTGKDRRLAWLLTASLLATVTVLILPPPMAMNVWNRSIFAALEARRRHRPVPLADLFSAAGGERLPDRGQVYARMTTQRRWRAWLTNHLLDRWLANGRYYQLNLVHGDHKNPEYRIADDVRIATDAPVDFATGVTRRSCRRRPSSSCCGRSAAR